MTDFKEAGVPSGRRVLLVEDNDLNRELIVELLENAGYEVIAETEAEAGLEVARSKRPDLILMDTQLPGMDGLAATRHLAEDPECAHIPVVTLSAHAMEGDHERAERAGAVGYLEKPINTRTFVGEVTAFLPENPDAPCAAGAKGSGETRSPVTVPQLRNRTTSLLIIDDEPYNRELLRELLDGPEYSIDSAEDGPSALQKIDDGRPDVILLDVMMPGMTGFEVCRRVKSDPRTAHIPVIMVTALHEREDRLKGIAAGADDFLRKPVDRHEVVLRVRNAAQRALMFEELDLRHRRLQEMEALRDRLTGMLVHDMRSPLTAISANLQLLEMDLEGTASQESMEDLQDARSGTLLLADMVSQILVVSRSRETRLEIEPRRVDFREVVRDALAPLRPLAREHRLGIDLPTDPVVVDCDPSLMRRTVSNLIGNAVKFVPQGEGWIEVRTRERGDRIRLEVEDNGPGVAPESHDAIFHQFITLSGTNGKTPDSSGVGLSFCKMTVEAHGGRIGIESEPGEGSLFWLEIPRTTPIEDRRSGNERRAPIG